MRLDWLNGNKRSISIVLLCASGVMAVLILVEVTRSAIVSAGEGRLITEATALSKSDPNEVKKHVTKSKEVADALKEKNLFAPPKKKENPVSQVAGIMGDEALINGKWYGVGAMIGEAKVVSIEPTQVKIEWEGKEKSFAPIAAADGPGADKGRPSRASSTDRRERRKDRSDGRERPGRRDRGRGRGKGKGRGMFGNMSEEERNAMREKTSNMSRDEKREYFRKLRDERGNR